MFCANTSSSLETCELSSSVPSDKGLAEHSTELRSRPPFLSRAVILWERGRAVRSGDGLDASQLEVCG